MATSYKAVQQIALRKLNEYEFKHNCSDRALDIVSFAEEFGFKVVEMPLGDDSGAIIISNDLVKQFGVDRVIVVNEDDYALRKRFTIAHELGHYFLGEYKNKGEFIELRNEELNSIYKPKNEKFADYFAAIILMPARKIVDLIEERQRKGKSVSFYDLTCDVSKQFLVSKAAASVRLSQLGFADE